MTNGFALKLALAPNGLAKRATAAKLISSQMKVFLFCHTSLRDNETNKCSGRAKKLRKQWNDGYRIEKKGEFANSKNDAP